MAVYFDAGRRKKVLLDDDVLAELMGDGNLSEIEGLSDAEGETTSVHGLGSVQLEEIEDAPSSLLEDIPGPSSVRPQPKAPKTRSGKIRKDPVIWKERPFANKVHDYPLLPKSNVRLPVDYFKDYINDEFFELAAESTNLYHFRKTGVLLNTTPTEMKKFVGIHIIMGCIPYPRLRMYWRTNMKLHMIADVMSRDRFMTLRTAFHLVKTDTQPNEEPKNPLWKVQPLLDMVKQACNKLERIPGFYSIDEQMIPFTGRCALRQVVKNKPRPVGLKNFVVTTSDGLMLNFDIYLGARTTFGDSSLGLGPSVILHLAKSVPPGSCLYFDRFLSTIPLIRRLTELNLHGTGTIMMNRIPNRQTIRFKKDTHMTRGQSQQCVSKDVVIVKWKDNKSVFVTSNCTGAGEEINVERWDKKVRAYVPITAPKIISNYNTYMGGVDVNVNVNFFCCADGGLVAIRQPLPVNRYTLEYLVDNLDQMIEYYRTFIKTKKWTLKVIIHFIDLPIANSWRLYKTDCTANNVPKSKTMDLLAFRLEVADSLLNAPNKKREVDNNEAEVDLQVPPQKYRRLNPSTGKRYDGYDHLPKFDDILSPRACAMENCSSRSKITCVKCKVYLCLSRGKDCFSLYHKK